MSSQSWYFPSGFTPTEFLKDLLERASAFSRGLGDRERHVWAILTGLRSCDSNDESVKLKGLTTARARHIVGLSGQEFTINRFPLSPHERQERDLLLKDAPPHFEYHFRCLVDAIIALYGYDILYECAVCGVCEWCELGERGACVGGKRTQGYRWKCSKGCEPDVDTPFFYSPMYIASELPPGTYDDGLGVLAYSDLSPSNRFVDGTGGVSKEVIEAIRRLHCLPYCIGCGKEVILA